MFFFTRKVEKKYVPAESDINFLLCTLYGDPDNPEHVGRWAVSRDEMIRLNDNFLQELFNGVGHPDFRRDYNQQLSSRSNESYKEIPFGARKLDFIGIEFDRPFNLSHCARVSNIVDCLFNSDFIYKNNNNDDFLIENSIFKLSSSIFLFNAEKCSFKRSEFKGVLNLKVNRNAGIKLEILNSDIFHFDISGSNFSEAFFMKSKIHNIYADKATFRGDFVLQQCVILSRFEGMNMVVEKKLSFEGTKIAKYCPNLRGTKLPDATEFHGVIWPRFSLYRYPVQQDWYSYQYLRKEMEGLKRFNDEMFFFGREMTSKIIIDIYGSNFFSSFVNFLFKCFSNYGTSIFRPFFLLGMTFLIFSNIYVEIIVPFDWGKACSLAAVGAFPFVPIKIGDVLGKVEAPEGLYPVFLLQSVLSFVFLFLIGLGLRNMFRLK